MITYRALNKDDAQMILDLYMGNPMFFQYCPPAPTLQGVYDDLEACPKGKENDKHFLGFFENNELIAVLDLIAGYPAEDTAWIGLFMCKDSIQHQGIGTKIIQALLRQLMKNGYVQVRLAYAEGNAQASSFWKKQGFIENGQRTDLDLYIAIGMTKGLSS